MNVPDELGVPEFFRSRVIKLNERRYGLPDAHRWSMPRIGPTRVTPIDEMRCDRSAG